MLRFRFETTDSTSTRAAALAEHHPRDVLLVTAREQHAGRGQHGRSWTSPAGGAWFSVAVPLEQPAEVDAGLRIAHALRDLLRSRYPDLASRVDVKPPNDVLIGLKKVAGVLCEQRVVAGRANATRFIAGVGLNANLDPAVLGDDLRRPATSLSAELGYEVNLDELIEAAARTIVATVTAASGHAPTP